MSNIFGTRRLPRLLAAAALGAGLLASTARGPARAQASDEPEVRALWVTRASLTTPASIASLVDIARAQRFNTLLVQVRGRGDAYYTSSIEPRAGELGRQPKSFDPLAAVLGAARPHGIRVHAWVSLNLVSSAVELPASPEHVVYRHADWLMVPRAIAQDVARLDPGNPAYAGKIARWTRAELNGVEGLYTSPIHPEAAAHAERVMADLARRYDLDGIHLDYARYPGPQFDYSRFSIAEFRAHIRPGLNAAVRRVLDEDAATDLFAYPDRFPSEWAAFRRARLTALVARIREAVRAARPEALVTSAVVPDPQAAFDTRLQDWRGWLDARLVDAVAPMAYTQESAQFVRQITAARDIAGGRAIWAGIGAYRLTPAQTIEHITAARRLGAAGIVLFSYDSLTGPAPPAPDYLATVSRAAFGPARSATEGPSR
jgi:uncharacterized lipoprotein YddW (UPF0748 family)